MNALEAIETISGILTELGAKEIKTNSARTFVEFRSAKCERIRYEAHGKVVKIRIFSREFTAGIYIRTLSESSALWSHIQSQSQRIHDQARKDS